MISRKPMFWMPCLGLAILCASPLEAGKPGGGKTDPVRVCVAFREDPGDLVGGDSSGPVYCDGANGVSATIGARQGVFKLDTTGKSSTREVAVNFPDCDTFPGIDVSGGDCLTPALLVTRNGYTSTGDPTGVKVNLLEMPVDNTSELVDFQINFPSTFSKSTSNVIVFGGQSAEPCGFPLTVSHPRADTWTITTPDPPDPEVEACLGEVVAKNGGREFRIPPFDLPFEIEITTIVP